MKDTLIKKINKSNWWHVPPVDPNAYKKRGKFLVSTYQQAEFYGRPSDKPERVKINNPLFGFSELEILKNLFSKEKAEKLLNKVLNSKNYYDDRIDLDAKMYRKAKRLGFDCIILMTIAGRKSLENNRKPHSIELNLIV